MKTLQQVIDALPPEEVKRRQRKLAAERRRGDGRAGYYFPKYSATAKLADRAGETPRERGVPLELRPALVAYLKKPSTATYVAAFCKLNYLTGD